VADKILKSGANKKPGMADQGRSKGNEKDKGQAKGGKDGGPNKRMSEFKRQLLEKQNLKDIYGLKEKPFRRFFNLAYSGKYGAADDGLLEVLERRLDNVVYRLKMAQSRSHARQMIVHGHFTVNGKKVKSPAIILCPGDAVALSERSQTKQNFLTVSVGKRLNLGIKVPEWLELDKPGYAGAMLRRPERSDISVQSETHLVVEFYCK
jgi:small subunit ribosomal protein S4